MSKIHEVLNKILEKTTRSDSRKTITTHLFWAYGEISNLEKICLNSFIRQGYALFLWTYGDMTDVPAGVILKDAREILPENRVFKYKNGSYAGFANLFRYAVLSQKGGLYVDTDVICLTPSDKLQTQPFLVSERKPNANNPESSSGVNNNVIYDPAPRPGDIIDLAFAFSERFPLDKLEWGDCGPRLLNMIAVAYPKLAFEIKEPDFANPIDYFNSPRDLLTPHFKLPRQAAFLHCYNESWRQAGIDKNAIFPEKSLMAFFAAKYLR
jgi:hypothetical protein